MQDLLSAQTNKKYLHFKLIANSLNRLINELCHRVPIQPILEYRLLRLQLRLSAVMQYGPCGR
jgi:hypothetical protein